MLSRAEQNEIISAKFGVVLAEDGPNPADPDIGAVEFVRRTRHNASYLRPDGERVWFAYDSNDLTTVPPSARGTIRCAGYDGASHGGFLEEYKDAWGVNFGRPADAWDKNWAKTHV